MKKFFSVMGMALLPVVGFAAYANNANLGWFQDILSQVFSILNFLIPFFTTLGVVYFIWNLVGYIKSSDPKAKDEYRSKVIMAVIFLFVIVSVWGLIRFLGTASGVQQGATDCIIYPDSPGC